MCVASCGDDAVPIDETNGGESESESESETECTLLEMTKVDHIAFDGDGCNAGPSESTVLTTQAEVDAHADAFCGSCSQQNCPEAPELSEDSMIVYAWTSTPTSPAQMEILSVEACGDTIFVTARAIHGCELAFSSGWDAVEIPASATPVEFDIELVRSPDCDE